MQDCWQYPLLTSRARISLLHPLRHPADQSSYSLHLISHANERNNRLTLIETQYCHDVKLLIQKAHDTDDTSAGDTKDRDDYRNRERERERESGLRTSGSSFQSLCIDAHHQRLRSPDPCCTFDPCRDTDSPAVAVVLTAWSGIKVPTVIAREPSP